ncbi:TPA: SHOCT domain-containing protein [Escherichia coli]|nr:SHOCT domain-containing protein [Escherichia coli]
MSELKFDITGVTGGLESAANKASGILDGLASGGVDGLTSSVGGLLGKLGPLGIAAGAALGALTALATGGAKMAVEYANMSREFGVNIEQIQKLEKVYSGFGLNAEKVLDINKDAAEKLGEAWRDGTGEFQAALKMIKGDIKDYAAFTDDPEGGRKAAEMWYYQAKAAGLSHSEIIAGMERIASDSSKMIGALSESNDYWEHQVKLQQKAAYVSEETATAYADAGSKLTELGKTIMGAFADLFSFLPKGFNLIYDYFTKDFANTTFYLSIKAISTFIAEKLPPLFQKAKTALTSAINPIINTIKTVQETMVNLYNKIAEIIAKVQNMIRKGGKTIAGWFGADADFLNFEIPALTTDNIKKGAKALADGIASGVSNGTATSFDELAEQERKKQAAELQAQADELKRKQEEENKRNVQNLCPICKQGAHNAADCPEAKKQKDAAKKAADEAKKLREKAYKDLEAINISLYSSVQASVASSNKQIVENLAKLDNALKQGIITQEQYEEKRRHLIDANAENFRKSVLGANPSDALQMLAASRQIYDQSVADLEMMYNNKLIKQSEYLQRKKDLEAAFSARTDATTGLEGIKSNEMLNSYGNRDQTFDEMKAVDVEKANTEYSEHKAKIDKLPQAEQFKQLQALNEAHNKRMREIDLKYNNMRLQDTQNMFGGFGEALQAFGLENNAVTKGIFAAQKGVSIAQGLLNAHEAATVAMAKYPGPLGVAMGAASYASAIARVAQMKSISVDGMAHDGIDNIPREGTWLLQKGERVVDDRTNGDLKDFLANQKNGNTGNSQPIEVHAPLQISGNVNSSDAMVMEAIKRHPKLVAQAVEDAQRRRM